MTATTDTVWIPAVPLPFQGVWRDRCGQCGQRFRGKNRRHAYEIHYHRQHLRGDTNPNQVSVEVTRGEARALYAEVNADTTEPPENSTPKSSSPACPPPEEEK